MRQIIPRIPPRAMIVGFILESDDFMDLSQDMLEVSLPDGVLIKCGWYPDSSPSGSYRVSVSRGLRQIARPVFSHDADVAAEDVAHLAFHFAALRANEPESHAEETVTSFSRIPQAV